MSNEIGLLHCTMYDISSGNEVLIGNRDIKVFISDDVYSSDSGDYKFSDWMSRCYGAGACTLFGPPAGITHVPDLTWPTIARTDSPFISLGYNDYVKFAGVGDPDRIRLKIKGTNKHIDILSSGADNSLSLNFQYYDNGSLKYSTNETTQGYYDFRAPNYWFLSSAISLPWCNKAKTKICHTNPTPHIVYTVAETKSNVFSGVDSGTTYRVARFLEWLGDLVPDIKDDDNPYWDGGTSDEGGGGGNFSDDSDTVDEDQLPNIDAVGTGFATLFTPSKAQLKSLSDVMWDNGIFQALQNLVENISNMFTSLAIVPFVVTPGNTVSVNFLGLFDTGISLTLAAKQYFEFDMGTINMADDSRIYTSGSALDYSPFSKLGIFLPFIGFQDLDIDECRDATIRLKYRIDILSGTCVALISVNGNPIYQFSGNCLSQIPITNENMQSLVTDAVNVGIAATASHAASGAVSSAESMLGEAQQAGSGVKTAETQLAHAEARKAITRGQLASATANASIGMKPSFGKAGSISASASLLAVKQPYLFLTTPRQSIPEHYQRYCGFPSNISGKLNEFSGYTVVEDIRLNGLVATSPEVAEIYELLKSGVII